MVKGNRCGQTNVSYTQTPRSGYAEWETTLEGHGLESDRARDETTVPSLHVQRSVDVASIYTHCNLSHGSFYLSSGPWHVMLRRRLRSRKYRNYRFRNYRFALWGAPSLRIFLLFVILETWLQLKTPCSVKACIGFITHERTKGRKTRSKIEFPCTLKRSEFSIMRRQHFVVRTAKGWLRFVSYSPFVSLFLEARVCGLCWRCLMSWTSE